MFWRLLALFLVSSLTAAPASPDLTQQLKDLQRAALQDDYAYEKLAVLCNSIGPRLSGSAQAEAAVDWVGAEMRALGLEVKPEAIMVPHWVRGQESCSLVDFRGAPVVLTTLGGSVATPAQGLTAEVAVVHDMRELAGQTLTGKIVVINVPWDERMAAQGQGDRAYGQHVRNRVYGPSAAARAGAVACLVRSWGSANYRLAHTGNLHYADDAPKIPAAAITSEDSQRIAWLAQRGPVRLHLVLTPQTLADAPSHNLIADLPGSEHPEQVVIVSGHLDSWDLATGALDDGCGVAMAMQTAHLFRKLNLRPRRTLRVIAWMNEENGGAGSHTYFEEHKGELANHLGAIESDLGAGHPLGIEVMARDPKYLERLAPVAEVLRASGAPLLEMVHGTGSDVSPLGAAGVPCFHPMVDSRSYFDYHHTPADTFDKIDPLGLKENCAVMAVLAYALTQMP